MSLPITGPLRLTFCCGSLTFPIRSHGQIPITSAENAPLSQVPFLRSHWIGQTDATNNIFQTTGEAVVFDQMMRALR